MEELLGRIIKIEVIAIFRKIITAVLSIVIFSFVMGFLMGEVQYIFTQHKPIWLLFVTMSVIGMYAAPVYLIGGIPASIFVDKMVKQISPKSSLVLYIIKFSLYSLAGQILSFIFMMILAIAEDELYWLPQELPEYLMYGLIASLIFCHVSLIVERIRK